MENYDYSSAYKAEDVPFELRGYYQEYSIAKTRANKWLAANGIPLLVSFKPIGEYDDDALHSNMALYVSYLLPNKAIYRFHELRLSKNQIRLNCFWNEIALRALYSWDNSDSQEHILSIAKEIEEVEAAYEAAYA